MVLPHIVACLNVFLLLGTATGTDTASGKGSANNPESVTYDKAVKVWKNCSFPDPSLYMSPPDASNPIPMLELCHTEDKLGDKPTEDKLFRFKLCKLLYSFSMLICQNNDLQEFRDKCLQKEAFTKIKPFNDSSDVCTAFLNYPSDYNSFTSLFNSPHCKENCGSSDNSMKDICVLYGTVLYQYHQYQHMKECLNPEGNTKSKLNVEASSDKTKSGGTSAAPLTQTTLPTSKEAVSTRNTPTPPADISNGTGGKEPEKMETVKPELLTVVPGSASVAGSSANSTVSRSVSSNASSTPKPQSEPQDDKSTPKSATTAQSAKGPEPENFEPVNQDNEDDDGISDGTDNDVPSDSDEETLSDPDDNDDNVSPTNTKTSPEKSPSDSINEDTEHEEKSTSNTENAEHNSPSDTENDKNTSQQENEVSRQQQTIDNDGLDENKNKHKTDASNALSDPDFEESPGSGHFLAYFLTAVVICITGYVIYHNKQKIMAFIIEGRNSGRSGRQRSKDVKYSQLKSSVEEVLPSLEQTATSKNFIY